MTTTCEAGELGGWAAGEAGVPKAGTWVWVGAGSEGKTGELGDWVSGSLEFRGLESWGLHPTPPCLQLHTLCSLVSAWVSTFEETQPGWPNACDGLGFGGLSIQNGSRRKAWRCPRCLPQEGRRAVVLLAHRWESARPCACGFPLDSCRVKQFAPWAAWF